MNSLDNGEAGDYVRLKKGNNFYIDVSVGVLYNNSIVVNPTKFKISQIKQ